MEGVLFIEGLLKDKEDYRACRSEVEEVGKEKGFVSGWSRIIYSVLVIG